ncbi:TonB-dependent receptor [Sphingobium sp. C100]|uniref:TonB-dependent receptor n=1 Tax=Sphingobium sp. C100 TaxID=1207055 RepID=UPI00041A167A|nr:TonB-dependent receptor [Sphingobium sp. C100]
MYPRRFLLIGTAMLASPSYAQVDAPGANDVGPEIIVTANKREQKLSDVGATVAVLGGEALARQQISDLADIAQAVPGLSFANSENGTPILTLRGVGFIESSLAAYPTVSVYVDEAPLPFGALAIHSAYDLERVEVLKGPQGTLFGQNSTGGAINFIAAKPTDDLSAGFNISYGRFNEVNGEAYVSGPLSGALKARVAARIERMDGWQISNSRPDDRNGKVRNLMGRLLLDWEAAPTARFSLNVNGWKDKSDTAAPQYIGYVQQNPVANPIIPTIPFSPEKPRAADWGGPVAGFEPFGDSDFWQVSLRGDIDLSDAITLTSLTSYLRFNQRQGADRDGLPYTVNDLISDGSIRSVFQELRLSNGGARPFRWVVGANYADSKVDQAADFDYRYTSVNETVKTFYGYDLTRAHYSNFQKLRSYAVFANGEYDLADGLTFKAGARYTRAKSTATICNTDLTDDARGTGAFLFDIVYGGAAGPFRTGDCFAGNDLGRTINGVAPGAPGEYRDRLSEDNISWTAGLDYKPRPGLLLYANVSRGYKAGSFPAVSATSFVQYRAVSQESVTAYESGVKASLLGGSLQVNAAGFYYDYRDKQLRSKVQSFFGIQDALVNVPRSTIKGFELETTMRPVEGLTLATGFTWLDAKIKTFQGISGGGLPADFADTRMPFAPKYQLSSNLDYEFPITGSLNAFVGGSMNLRSNTIAVVGGDTNAANAVPTNKMLQGIDNYILVDARVGIAGPDDAWRLMVFAKNIFNTYYWNNAVTSSDAVARFAGTPATYGVSLSMRM